MDFSSFSLLNGMAEEWRKIGSFVLSGDELNEVLIEVEGAVRENRLRYADCLAKQISLINVGNNDRNRL